MAGKRPGVVHQDAGPPRGGGTVVVHCRACGRLWVQDGGEWAGGERGGGWMHWVRAVIAV